MCVGASLVTAESERSATTAARPGLWPVNVITRTMRAETLSPYIYIYIHTHRRDTRPFAVAGCVWVHVSMRREEVSGRGGLMGRF